jgi:ribonuclease PH
VQALTVPQGVIDMNKCVDVHDAEEQTSHKYSVAVMTADKATFIKGTNKEETTRYEQSQLFNFTACCNPGL